MMSDGFLSRWSRRKAGIQDELVEQKKEPAKPPVEANPEEKVVGTEAPPPVTLDDVEKIDRFAPDFSAFMKPDVDPAVQQAALKKMFTDPHFNVMDGLDIYIDDYSKPDPLPAGMLERMVQSDMLKLFRKEESVEGGNQSLAQQQGSSDQSTPQLEAQKQTDLRSTDSTLSQLPDEVPAENKQKKT